MSTFRLIKIRQIMSEYDTINLTPPLRSIADEASSLAGSNDVKPMKKQIRSNPSVQKIRERSPSSSSLTSSSSSSSSSRSHSVRPDPYNDASSIDDSSIDLAQLEYQLQTLRRLSKLMRKKKY